MSAALPETQPGARLAAIDVGSNSIRLIVAELDVGNLLAIHEPGTEPVFVDPDENLA